MVESTTDVNGSCGIFAKELLTRMKRFLWILPLALLLLTACKEKRSFTNVPSGEIWLSQIVFEDGSKRDFTVVSDVVYAGRDTSSRYKMIFYLPDGWDQTYPIFLDRYVPNSQQAAWMAYQAAPHAEKALQSGDMIVVLLAYEEWSAIPDILLARHFLIENDADLPGNSQNILTSAYFEFE